MIEVMDYNRVASVGVLETLVDPVMAVCESCTAACSCTCEFGGGSPECTSGGTHDDAAIPRYNRNHPSGT